jgi:hypothetical protein
MSSFFRRAASLALLAVLASAHPARAADSTATEPSVKLPTETAAPVTPPPATAPKPTAPKPTTGSIPGRAGIGGLLGGSWYVASGDYWDGSLPRFALAGSFRYQINEKLRFQLSPGFTWSGYSKHSAPPFIDPNFPTDVTKENYIVQLVPISAEIQFTRRGHTWTQHIGLGPGVYRVLVQHHRRDLLDPVTFRVHRGMYLGGTLEYGAEKYFKGMPNTSVEVNLANHWVNAVRDDQFPSGWNDWLSAAAVQVGVNYYFDVAKLKPKEETPLPSTGKKK